MFVSFFKTAFPSENLSQIWQICQTDPGHLIQSALIQLIWSDLVQSSLTQFIWSNLI